MSSGNFDLTTYYAKRIIGDAAAATAANALLQTGDGITSNTWILHRTNRTTKKYGIHYAYDGTNGHDTIEFYGKETNDDATAWIQLDTGDASFNSILGKVEITNIDIPNTATSYYFPYVGSSSSGVQALLTSGRIYLYEGTNRTHICIGSRDTRRGGITIWGENGSNYTDIITEAATSNKTVHIPNYTGWIAVGGDGSSTGVGNSYRPVYLSASGQLTTTTSYFVNGSTNSHQLGGFSVVAASTTHTNVADYAGHRLTLMTTDDGLLLWDNDQSAEIWSWRKNSSGIWQGSITGNAVTATRANITTTKYGIAYYSDAIGTFASTTYGAAGQVLIGKGSNDAADWYGGLTLTGTQASDWKVTINGTSEISTSDRAVGALVVNGGASFASAIRVNGWVRTFGDNGWYSQTHGGGLCMRDDTYVRMYGNKQFLITSGITPSATNLSSQLIVSSLGHGTAADSLGSTSGGTVAIELWRGSNASWQISNNAGTLYFKNNWTTAIQTTYTQTAMSIAYNTGNTTISGELTVNNLIKSTYNSNTVTIGSQNANWCHIYNSADVPFIFNKSVQVVGKADLGGTSYPWGNLYIGGNDNGIYFVGTKNNYRMIRFIDNTADIYGNGISIGGGGVTILGSGESSDTLITNLSLTGGTETTYIASDGNIEFYPTQNTYDASARIWMTASVLNIGVDGNTTRESSINIYSGAGRIQLYSAASATGNRGLWVAAHGTGNAKNVILVDTNNNVTLNGNAATATCVIHPDASVSYVAGAKGTNAAVFAKKEYNQDHWYPAVSLQTKGGGAWQIGNYNDETLEFVYFPKDKIDSSTNSGQTEVYITSAGVFSGSISGNAATATRINGNLTAATSDVNRNIWVSSGAGADGIPNYISGFNMNPSTKVFTVPAGTRISPSAGALYLGNSGNQSWVYVQDICGQDGQKWKIHQNGNAEFTGTVTAPTFSGNASSADSLSGGLVTNTVTSHGNLAVTTAKGSYYGINFGHNASGMSIMSINASHQGLYNQTNGQWIIYYNAASASKSISIGSSTVNVTGGISLNLNTYLSGTLTMTGNQTITGAGAHWTKWQNTTTGVIISMWSDTTNQGIYSYSYWNGSANASGAGWILYRGTDSYVHTSFRLYGAVWNDYAEYRECDKLNPGTCVQEHNNGHLTQSDRRLIPGASIISDTFGFAEGQTEKADTPIAVSGRVLACTYRDRYEYHAGQAVCSAPNGTVDIMSRDEIMMYPDAIVGIVSEIPEYEEWGTDHIKVNNRIWIKVK